VKKCLYALKVINHYYNYIVMDTDSRVLSNFKPFGGNAPPTEIVGGGNMQFFYSFSAIIALFVLAGVIYYYQIRIHATISNALNKLLLHMHINPMGQFVSYYIPNKHQ